MNVQQPPSRSASLANVCASCSRRGRRRKRPLAAHAESGCRFRAPRNIDRHAIVTGARAPTAHDDDDEPRTDDTNRQHSIAVGSKGIPEPIPTVDADGVAALEIQGLRLNLVGRVSVGRSSRGKA